MSQLVPSQEAPAVAPRADAALGLAQLATTGREHIRLDVLRPVRIADIRNALEGFDLSFIWRSDKYEPDRKGVRTCLSARDGLGADLKMTYSVAYLAKATGSVAYLPSEGDPTLIDYLSRMGLLPSGFVTVGGFNEMQALAETRGRKIYSVDDLGSERDPISAVSQEAMEFVNNKSNVARLAGSYAPPERITTLRDLSVELYQELKPSSGIVYIKTCTGEGGGMGVLRIESAEHMSQTIKEMRSQYSPDEELIVQPEIKGRNFRFQIFLDPHRPDTIPVVSLTEQVVADDGIRYTGSRPIPVNEQNLAVIGDAIVEFAHNIRTLFPSAVGFASCDFFRTVDHQTILFDPALRPTGNTAAFMIRLDFEERGINAVVSDYQRIKLNAPNMPFSEVEQALGHLMDARRFYKEGVGIIPWGYNQYQGEGTFMVAGNDEEHVQLLWKTAQELLRAHVAKRV